MGAGNETWEENKMKGATCRGEEDWGKKKSKKKERGEEMTLRKGRFKKKKRQGISGREKEIRLKVRWRSVSLSAGNRANL